ncbi:MAG: bifunctional phosphoribosylaminoimidazolecarboxamide formyltransferase/IMP cyclohydrolase [Pseudomonadota bacterium]
MQRMALLSVSDRAGLGDLAKALSSKGYTLLATSGTGKLLNEVGIPFTSVESYTGLAELLDGRVKTLHPKIHGGILARRDLDHHRAQLEQEGIAGIDLVVVNLYPFTKYLESERAANPEEMTELVDVGGPTMIRAAAKNHRFVLPLIDPADYPRVIEMLEQGDVKGDPFPLAFRRELAAKVFSTLSAYDGAIGGYFAGLASGDAQSQDGFPEKIAISLTKESDLRYGENPHQRAAIYRVASASMNLLSGSAWRQLGGKELSYNNMLDFDAALRLLIDLPSNRTAVAILKHLNPCGVALADSVEEAIVRAKQCDPRSHFGGILVCNRELDSAAAEEIRGDFAEIVIAPKFSDGALTILRTSKNLRIIEVEVDKLRGVELRTVAGGVLVQEPDAARTELSPAQLSSRRVPTEDELIDLDLAWRLVGHVKSNAIVLVRGGLLIGVGAGQMSRIDSIELAISKAKTHGHLLSGAVAASDAFFPFPDSIEALASEGIRCVVSPAGARRDDEVKVVANERDISLFFAADRHFRH